MNASAQQAALLVLGASEVATVAGGVRRGSAQQDAGRMEAGAVAAAGDRIVAVGTEEDCRRRLESLGIGDDRLHELNARGGTVTPGLVDPHTHLLFAGTREREFELRRRGASYLEVLQAGGGIHSTVEATTAASDDELLAHGRRWLAQMMRNGVTTAEAKSGYALDRDGELRLLALTASLGEEGPVELVPTYLGAHAVPERHARAADPAAAYVEEIIKDHLPGVAAQGIARFCDVFCERAVFPVQLSRRVLEAARELGLELRLHADELEDSGGARLAAELGARSADHLGAVSQEGLDALATASVVAVLLPATALVLGAERRAPARRLVDSGVPVALGTDFNPGTSPTANLPLVMGLACHELGLSASEALVAATINAAATLGMGETHGSLEDGKQADLVVWDVPSHAQIPYWLGADLVRTVVKRGRVVHDTRA